MSENKLSLEEQATNAQTLQHIQRVQHYLHRFAKELLDRAEKHDQSKLGSPEVELFTEFTPKLAGSTYGSPEYEGFRKAMGPALAHHYAACRHHPEHFDNGIWGMNLVDVVEMLCDWLAAVERHANGDPFRSLEINRGRFGIADQLVSTIRNTLPVLLERSDALATVKHDGVSEGEVPST